MSDSDSDSVVVQLASLARKQLTEEGGGHMTPAGSHVTLSELLGLAVCMYSMVGEDCVDDASEGAELKVRPHPHQHLYLRPRNLSIGLALLCLILSSVGYPIVYLWNKEWKHGNEKHQSFLTCLTVVSYPDTHALPARLGTRNGNFRMRLQSLLNPDLPSTGVPG